MTALVRSASLTNFMEVAGQYGLDGRALLAEVGLPLRCLDDPDLKIAASKVARLLEMAAERADEPAFGLRMAESRRLSNLGPLGLLVRDEPTLRSTLEALVRHMHLHNEALALHVEQSSNLVVIRQVMVAEGSGPLRQATRTRTRRGLPGDRHLHGGWLASAPGVLLAPRTAAAWPCTAGSSATRWNSATSSTASSAMPSTSTCRTPVRTP